MGDHVSTEKPAHRHADRALAFLARLATEFMAVLSLAELVDHVLEALDSSLGFDSSTVGLLDEGSSDVITLVGCAGIRSDFRGLKVPRAQGLNWAVMDSMRPLYVPDMRADPRVFQRHPGVNSGIYTPLIIGGRSIGVLSAHRSEVDAFTSADLDALTIVGRYLAGAFEVARLYEQLRTQAATDALTGVPNRRSFMDRLPAELERSRRSARPLSVVLADLDGFKGINDAYGHAAGDRALIACAEALTRHIRAYDYVARFGGDEFVLLFPDTPSAQADAIIGRMRNLEVLGVGDSDNMRLRVSWGIAVCPDDGDNADALVRTADTRLYAMKHRV